MSECRRSNKSERLRGGRTCDSNHTLSASHRTIKQFYNKFKRMCEWCVSLSGIHYYETALMWQQKCVLLTIRMRVFALRAIFLEFAYIVHTYTDSYAPALYGYYKIVVFFSFFCFSSE